MTVPLNQNSTVFATKCGRLKLLYSLKFGQKAPRFASISNFQKLEVKWSMDKIETSKPVNNHGETKPKINKSHGNSKDETTNEGQFIFNFILYKKSY